MDTTYEISLLNKRAMIVQGGNQDAGSSLFPNSPFLFLKIKALIISFFS